MINSTFASEISKHFQFLKSQLLELALETT